MMTSKIEWTDETWNPVTGCTKVGAGCANCYAENFVKRFPDQLNKPLHWKKPRKVFVCSMGDLFHEDVTDAFIGAVFAMMALAEQHTFQILTKRPERMQKWMEEATKRLPHRWWMEEALIRYGFSKDSPEVIELVPERDWPLPNVWLGVSVWDQESADEFIPPLLETPAAVRFVSYEPALGPVDFSHWLNLPELDLYQAFHDDPLVLHLMQESLIDGSGNCRRAIDWIIMGGESGSKARPMHPDWVRFVRDQCAEAGVPFFFKQWGEYVPCSMFPGSSPDLIITVDGDTCYPSRFIEDGKIVVPENIVTEHHTCITRVGKKAAGSLLDGVEHKEFPKGGTNE